jgi:hypothetical protein
MSMYLSTCCSTPHSNPPSDMKLHLLSLMYSIESSSYRVASRRQGQMAPYAFTTMGAALVHIILRYMPCRADACSLAGTSHCICRVVSLACYCGWLLARLYLPFEKRRMLRNLSAVVRPREQCKRQRYHPCQIASPLAHI